jgi:hypothetical protein
MEIYTSQKLEKESICRLIIEAGREILPDFELNEYDREVYFRLFLYFFGDITFEKFHSSYKLRKGLWVIGPIGVGKTVLFLVFKRLLKQFNQENDFGIFKPIDIAGMYSIRGHEIIISNSSACFHLTNGFVDKSRPKSRLYDDLGGEELKTSYFGSKINVMEKILLMRYDLFISTGMKTHITTNLDGEKIEKHYGARVRSRLRQMTNAIYYPGVDRRK